MIAIRNWSTRRRLSLAFVGILTPFVAVTGIVMVASRTIQGQLTIQEEMLDIERTTNLRLSWNQLVLAMKDYMVIGGPKERMQLDRLFRSKTRDEADGDG